MKFSETLKSVQKSLLQQNLDGWLLYDFHGLNPLAHDFLQIPTDQVVTRRYLYWIPARGEPVKIVHEIEPYALDHLPGEKHIYLKWQTLDLLIGQVLRGQQEIAMEYSPRNAVPYISKVDGGMLDLVHGHGVKVVSSGSLLQAHLCVWDDAQLKSHLFAAKVLEEAVAGAWDLIGSRLQNKRRVTEYEVQQQLLETFSRRGCVTDHAPTCSVGPHSAMPHYTATEKNRAEIHHGDIILIDLWCKQSSPKAVFADITRMGVAAERPTAKQKEVFHLVRQAQKAAIDFITARYVRGEPIKGYEADDAARKVIVEGGYGDFFTHRTGHNIHTDVHGPGTHLDNLETHDDRPLMAGTCFSVEPGIYLPGEFGVRLETDVYLGPHGKAQVTGGLQDEFYLL